MFPGSGMALCNGLQFVTEMVDLLLQTSCRSSLDRRMSHERQDLDNGKSRAEGAIAWAGCEIAKATRTGAPQRWGIYKAGDRWVPFFAG